MKAILRTYLNPPRLTRYEREQRRKTLSYILTATAIGTTLLGLVNTILVDDARATMIALFSATILCLLGMWLNRTGHYLSAALLLWGLVFFAANFNLLDGNGLHDPGILSYPILIVMVGLLFGKRTIVPSTFFIIASLALIAYLENFGIIQVSSPANLNDFITLSILLIASAAVMWVIMENSDRNLERITEDEVKLKETYDLTLEGWAKAMEYRDSETEGHCRRVVELTVDLAKQLGCSPQEIEHIRRGVLLHDIGKMAIPDSILHKPGPLDIEERQTIERHPVYAQNMLAQIPFLKTAVNIPYFHHERWDGHGYPEGLKGEEIPLEARIFAVVDVWDALCSNRPYRGAWTKEKATEYISENAGKMFDPKVVEIFLGLISDAM
jgi:putative nucleotidyltransferase with HDIG domain